MNQNIVIIFRQGQSSKASIDKKQRMQDLQVNEKNTRVFKLKAHNLLIDPINI